MLELLTHTGTPRYKRGATRIYASRQQRNLELELGRQAEIAYARLVKDWQPAINKPAGATTKRASTAEEQKPAQHAQRPQLAPLHTQPANGAASRNALDFHP
jgi:hypothetical protein